MTRAAALIEIEKGVRGHPYLLGAKWSGTTWPEAGQPVDCSGLQTWAMAMLFDRYPVPMVQTAAGPMPTHEFLSRFQGSWAQGALCRPVPKVLALGPTGAGLFLLLRPDGSRHGHIALSLGYGRTIESRGSKGVCIVTAAQNATRWLSSRAWAGKLDVLFTDLDAANDVPAQGG